MRFSKIAVALLLFGPALLAGCLEDAPTTGAGADGADAEMDPATPFTSAGAPPVALHHQPVCGGPCFGHEAFAVFANGRAILVSFHMEEGPFDVVPGEGVRYGMDELEHVFRPLRHGTEPEHSARTEHTFRVESVETGTLDPGAYWQLTEALLRNWTAPASPSGPPDYTDAVGPGDFVRWMADGGTEALMSDPVYATDDPARHHPETVTYMGLVDAFRAARDAFLPAEGVDGASPEGGAPGDVPATAVLAEAHDGGGEYWFTFRLGDEVRGVTVEGERNPTLHLEAGVNVTVHFVNRGEQAHNLHFGAPVNASTDILKPGERATLELGAPHGLDIAFEYWCDPHKALGMMGEGTVSSP